MSSCHECLGPIWNYSCDPSRNISCDCYPRLIIKKLYYIEIVLYKTILLEKPPRYLRRKSWNLFGGIPGQKLSTFRNNLLRKSFRKISKGTPWVHGLVTSREIHGKNDKALQKLSEEFWNFRLKVQEEFMKHFLKKKIPGRIFAGII